MEHVAMKAPDISMSTVRFQRPESPYSSQPSDCWANALNQVDTNPVRIIDHPQRSIFKGYAFPIAHILCADEGKSMEMVLAWLVVRTRWMSHLSSFQSRTIPLPHSHQWRMYLRDIALEFEFLRPDTRKQRPPPQDTGKLSHTARRNAKSREAAKDIFSVRTPTKGAIQSLNWNGRVVWRPGQIDFPPTDRQLVVWDVQEHNFHLELLNLDRCVLANVWRTSDGALLRERKIRSVFVHESILSADLPPHPCGFSSNNWEERRPYIEAFCSVLVDWPKAPPPLHSSIVADNEGAGPSPWSRVAVERSECLAAAFYCQTFFDYFGRAACIPHLLPSKV